MDLGCIYFWISNKDSTPYLFFSFLQVESNKVFACQFLYLPYRISRIDLLHQIPFNYGFSCLPFYRYFVGQNLYVDLNSSRLYLFGSDGRVDFDRHLNLSNLLTPTIFLILSSVVGAYYRLQFLLLTLFLSLNRLFITHQSYFNLRFCLVGFYCWLLVRFLSLQFGFSHFYLFFIVFQ